jgi:hypothetical protein
MDDESDKMSEEEKAEMFGAMIEQGEVKQMNEEEWKNLMPDKSPTLRERAIGAISVLMMLALITSPIWVYINNGFEMAVVTFLTVYLLVLTQSS